MLDLASITDVRPNLLSIGQTQRVALGRALVLEPDVLLLDEPLGAIELVLRQHMLTELRRVNQDLGITFIHVSHDKDEALLVADRIVLMNKGRIEQVASARDIYRLPETEFVARFFQNANIVEGTIVSVTGRTARIENQDAEFTVETERPLPPPGQAVRVVIPYDRVSRQSPSSSCNCLEGDVAATQLMGTYSNFCLTLDSGNEFRFVEHKTITRSQGEPNGRVVVYWRPEEAILLTDRS